MKTNNLLFGLFCAIIFLGGIVIGNFFPYNSPTAPDPAVIPVVQNTQSNTLVSSSTTVSKNSTTSITSNLSADQKRMLDMLGIDVQDITPEMITCAETSIGANRVTEIKNGAEISTSEKFKLINCYK